MIRGMGIHSLLSLVMHGGPIRGEFGVKTQMEITIIELGES